MEPTVLESCHSTWIFDTDHFRFRRILRDIEVGHEPVSTQWRSYSLLLMEPGEEAFTVVLNDDRSRCIRSFRHLEGCVSCGTQRTGQVSLADIRSAVSV